MAVNNNGGQAFGITTASFSGFIIESYNVVEPGDSVELQDGNGEDIGRVTIPRAKTFTMTVQVGSGNTVPTVGAEITYGSAHIVQNVTVVEQQATHQRLNIDGYLKIN